MGAVAAVLLGLSCLSWYYIMTQADTVDALLMWFLLVFGILVSTCSIPVLVHRSEDLSGEFEKTWRCLDY